MIDKNEFPIAQGPFEPTVESLAQFQCPDWFRDAKFGVWCHWGPQSVPMYGDWYARDMYIEGSEKYRYHCRRYGHPSKFGYKDIVKLWKAEHFDPAALMDLFVACGAKYFVGQAMHHDNFDCFDSKWNEWNSTKVGPMRDICGEFRREAKRCGLPFGLTEHLAASYTWFSVSHGADQQGPYAGVPYDGADPRFESLYRDNSTELLNKRNWHTHNEKYHADWLRRMMDLIDKYAPDLLYSDGELPFFDYGLHMVAHLYNTSAAQNGGVSRALYNFKQQMQHVQNHTPGITQIGVLDIERGVSEEALAQPWQDDTSIGDWFYNVRWGYKPAAEVLQTLVDVVAKNGNLLLNVTQKPDGSLDDEILFILKQIGAWFKDNGHGIYGSRPRTQAAEGPTSLHAGEMQEKAADFTREDFRFTQKGSTVYAFQTSDKIPAKGTCYSDARNYNFAQDRAAVYALGRNFAPAVKAVTVCGKPAAFEQADGALLVQTGENPHKGLPLCIAAQF
jgi:alpha-L-fucosidase